MFNTGQSHLQDILEKNIFGYPIEMSMLSTQILVSKCYSPLKGTWAHWRNADSISGAGKVEDVSEVSFYETDKKDSTSRKSTQKIMSEGHGSHLEGALTGQI